MKNKNKKKEPINPMDIIRILFLLFGLGMIIATAVLILYFETHSI